MKLGAKELRITPPEGDQMKNITRNPITIVLDNVLDTYNIGAIFRLADALAVEKVYITGEALTPPHPQIAKSSVGAWRWVPWEYEKTAVEVIDELREQRTEDGKQIKENRGQKGESKNQISIIAIEQSKKSVPFHNVEYKLPLVLVVGNETYGVSREVLDIADTIVEIPMWGVNKSLNVMVSTAIVLYEVMKQLNHE